MNLPQQLEDKKKEKEKMEEYYIYPYHMEQDKEALEKYNKLCFEIAILEQAIAEIKNIQSQQRKPCGDTPTQQQECRGTNPEEGKVSMENDTTNSADISNLLQKQRQEEIDFLNKLDWEGFYDEIHEGGNLRNNSAKSYGIYLWFKQRMEQLNQPKTEQWKKEK